MTLLADILQGDRTDLDLIQLTLETLANVMTYEVGNDEGIHLLTSLHPVNNLSFRTSKFTTGYYRSIHRYWNCH